MTYQKVVKVSSKSLVLNPSKWVCWMSIEILASKIPDVIGTYRRLSHTVLSCIVSCVRISEQDVWCWWITFGNCVLKAEWLSGLWNYTYVFLRFFKIQKTWLFTLRCGAPAVTRGAARNRNARHRIWCERTLTVSLPDNICLFHK